MNKKILSALCISACLFFTGCSTENAQQSETEIAAVEDKKESPEKESENEAENLVFNQFYDFHDGYAWLTFQSEEKSESYAGLINKEGEVKGFTKIKDEKDLTLSNYEKGTGGYYAQKNSSNNFKTFVFFDKDLKPIFEYPEDSEHKIKALGSGYILVEEDTEDFSSVKKEILFRDYTGKEVWKITETDDTSQDTVVDALYLGHDVFCISKAYENTDDVYLTGFYDLKNQNYSRTGAVHFSTASYGGVENRLASLGFSSVSSSVHPPLFYGLGFQEDETIMYLGRDFFDAESPIYFMNSELKFFGVSPEDSNVLGKTYLSSIPMVDNRIFYPGDNGNYEIIMDEDNYSLAKLDEELSEKVIQHQTNPVLFYYYPNVGNGVWDEGYLALAITGADGKDYIGLFDEQLKLTCDPIPYDSFYGLHEGLLSVESKDSSKVYDSEGNVVFDLKADEDIKSVGMFSDGAARAYPISNYRFPDYLDTSVETDYIPLKYDEVTYLDKTGKKLFNEIVFNPETAANLSNLEKTSEEEERAAEDTSLENSENGIKSFVEDFKEASERIIADYEDPDVFNEEIAVLGNLFHSVYKENQSRLIYDIKAKEFTDSASSEGKECVLYIPEYKEIGLGVVDSSGTVSGSSCVFFDYAYNDRNEICVHFNFGSGKDGMLNGKGISTTIFVNEEGIITNNRSISGNFKNNRPDGQMEIRYVSPNGEVYEEGFYSENGNPEVLRKDEKGNNVIAEFTNDLYFALGDSSVHNWFVTWEDHNLID